MTKSLLLILIAIAEGDKSKCEVLKVYQAQYIIINRYISTH